MGDLQSVFSQKLRGLCRSKPSISSVAQDLSINRQQFARYVNGASIPRQAIIDRISEYFSVSPAYFFGQEEFPVFEESDSSLSALFSVLNKVEFEPIRKTDLATGFYLQVKHGFSRDGYALRTLVYVSQVNGTFYYRSASYGRSPDKPVSLRNYNYKGVFVKKGRNLLLVAINEMSQDLNIHVFSPSFHFDSSIRPGVHMFLTSGNRSGVKSTMIFLRKLGPSESVLETARSSGWVKEADLEYKDREILSGSHFETKGVIGLG